ncbi:unnamed protein product [Polarella glacialis]|uniref:Glycosyl transferase 48 domain-containing protein n=1 Tax=Polarella glacialis TaxID=89957 RepID=A0A813JWN0_POLGL|nr:unnamed protein product [Polarella glacialis]
MRLGQLLPLPEYLTFYYAHMGYYINQWLVSWGLPVLTLAWLIVILNGCEDRNDISISCHEGIQNASSVIAEAWQYIYSRSLLLVFMIAQMAPVFMENWMQAGIVSAMSHMLKQLLTMSPIMFIFQAKVIGFYTMNELKFGGATYVATGRGLPTERRPFIGTVASDGQLVIGGLYTDYARITYYDGASLVALIVLILVSGGTVNTGPQLIGMMISLWLVSVSWLFAPFIFNPYQFRASCFTHDLKAWFRFFFDDYGNVWKKWYMQDQVKPRRGFRATILDLSFFIELFWVLCCFVSLNAKTAFLIQVSESWRRIYVLMLMPPIFLPLIFCIGAACCGACLRRCRGRREVRRKAKKPTVTKTGTTWWPQP